jgi:hypothetical protein
MLASTSRVMSWSSMFIPHSFGAWGKSPGKKRPAPAAHSPIAMQMIQVMETVAITAINPGLTTIQVA